MGAKNKVVAGEYKGKDVLTTLGTVQIVTGLFKTIILDKKMVENYEVLSGEHHKSMASGAVRGLIGGFLLGPAGLLAGGLSAKKKGVFLVAIEFTDGKKSLLEINEKVYKNLIKSCF